MGLMDDGRRANVAHVTHAVRVTCATCRTTTAAAYDYASAASPTAGVPAFGPPSGGSTSVVTGVHRLSGSGTPKSGSAVLVPAHHADTGVTVRVEQRIAFDFGVVARVVDHQILGVILGLGERVVAGAVLAVLGAGLEHRHRALGPALRIHEVAATVGGQQAHRIRHAGARTRST